VNEGNGDGVAVGLARDAEAAFSVKPRHFRGFLALGGLVEALSASLVIPEAGLLDRLRQDPATTS
jgi:hypothetical protein